MDSQWRVIFAQFMIDFLLSQKNKCRWYIGRRNSDAIKRLGKNAYTLYKYFKNSNSNKISKEFNEYKNELISNGFKFYEESFDHYT